MKHTTIIIAGQQFSKSELVEIFDAFASTSPLAQREEAWQIAEAIDAMELKAIQKTLEGLRLLDEAKYLRAKANKMRIAPELRNTFSTNAPLDEAEANDYRTSQLIKAIAKEVLK